MSIEIEEFEEEVKPKRRIFTAVKERWNRFSCGFWVLDVMLIFAVMGLGPIGLFFLFILFMIGLDFIGLTEMPPGFYGND
tara:strand:+ start:171 stop:410 length:240 start_codon:yes stop_codon:yes gene_type:complete